MNMIDIHATALNNKIASYHEFLMRYSKRGKVVYGFVEGKEDPCFYRGFIDLLLPEHWRVELWPAGNKNRVYEIYRDIDWRRFQKSRICFFVDRDLSDLIPETIVSDRNIYVTTGYSIENDVVNKATCNRVLTELCGFSNADHNELESVCDLFEQELDTFLQAMVPIMAWILVWKRNKLRPNLNDIQLNKLFSINNGRLQSNILLGDKTSTSEYIHDQCDVQVIPNIDIAGIQTEFIKDEKYRIFIRGKYVFWFLVEFCNSVHRDAASLFNSISKPPKMHLNLSTSGGFAVIGSRSRFPISLRDFLTATFSRYIQKVEQVKSPAWDDTRIYG